MSARVPLKELCSLIVCFFRSFLDTFCMPLALRMTTSRQESSIASSTLARSESFSSPPSIAFEDVSTCGNFAMVQHVESDGRRCKFFLLDVLSHIFISSSIYSLVHLLRHSSNRPANCEWDV